MPEIQDTIHFQLTEEGAVTNNTIRITATLAGHIDPDSPDEKLWADIRDTVARFIPKVDWQFSDTRRFADPAGGERINITATTRAPVSENRALEQRSRDAGRLGLMISQINVDTTPPVEDERQTERKLRLAVLKLAIEEADTISRQTGRTYRVGSVNFIETSSSRHSNRPAMAAMSMSHDLPAGGGPAEIGNTTKLIVTAAVELRTGANDKHKK